MGNKNKQKNFCMPIFSRTNFSQSDACIESSVLKNNDPKNPQNNRSVYISH